MNRRSSPGTYWRKSANSTLCPFRLLLPLALHPPAKDLAADQLQALELSEELRGEERRGEGLGHGDSDFGFWILNFGFGSG